LLGFISLEKFDEKWRQNYAKNVLIALDSESLLSSVGGLCYWITS